MVGSLGEVLLPSLSFELSPLFPELVELLSGFLDPPPDSPVLLLSVSTGSDAGSL